jgi:thymidylate synthase
MEALWILAGRNDVAWVCRYLENLRRYSDDGVTFNAAYGHRMRKHFVRYNVRGIKNETFIADVDEVDQLLGVIRHLKSDRDSRRAVMSFWDPTRDLGLDSKDIPCNDALMFKVRDGALDLTVCCRSNDAIWGAYGANAVQFSMIQEFVAGALQIPIGHYRQISDSFHIYVDNEAWRRVETIQALADPYANHEVINYPLFVEQIDHSLWLEQLGWFMEDKWHPGMCSFFKDVAFPIKQAWDCYKEGQEGTKIAKAIEQLKDCRAIDWKRACIEWLLRREKP